MTEARLLYARFRTQRHCYIYDTYSNAILRTPPEIWEQIDRAIADPADADAEDTVSRADVRAAVAEARAAGFLLPCHVKTMAFYLSDDILRARVTGAIAQLTLEVTERCNLRCRYCAFAYDSQRTSKPTMMPLETARKAIATFLSHSGLARERAVSFWGGEPLLAFGLIRDVVRCTNEYASDQPVLYSFTTNATLITDEIASFLAKNRFRLLVSLDGPRHIHDKNRRRRSGGGSFDHVLAGLRRLRAVAPQYYQQVRFNCVLAQDTSVAEVQDFFDSHELVAGHHVTIAGANHVGLPDTDETARFRGLTFAQLRQAKTVFLSKATDDAAPEAGAQFYTKGLESIALRARAPLGEYIHPNGCCVPLLRKMMVRANGDIYMCEQPPYQNRLGNMNTGVDFDGAIKMVLEYCSRSLPQCSRCWAMRLCGMCYRHKLEECRWGATAQSLRCDGTRRNALRALAEYTAVCEQNPGAFEYLKNYVFSFPV